MKFKNLLKAHLKGIGKVLSEGTLFKEILSFYKAAGSNYPIKNIVL